MHQAPPSNIPVSMQPWSIRWLCRHAAAQDGTGSMLPRYQNAVVSQRNVIYNGLNGSDARILTTGGDQVSADRLSDWAAGPCRTKLLRCMAQNLPTSGCKPHLRSRASGLGRCDLSIMSDKQ